MSDRGFGDRGEPEDARSRIERIRQGQQQQSEQPAYDEQDDFATDSRVQPGAGRIPSTEPAPRRAPSGSTGSRALLFIGGIVGIGVIVVLVIVLLSGVLTGGGGGVNLPFGATETPIPTATLTPSPTPTEMPTATATPAPPNLSLPPLTCIFQSGTGCSDYCADAENEQECTAARDFIAAQEADPDVWFECLSPGPGANVGNPQECLVEAWYANLEQ